MGGWYGCAFVCVGGGTERGKAGKALASQARVHNILIHYNYAYRKKEKGGTRARTKVKERLSKGEGELGHLREIVSEWYVCLERERGLQSTTGCLNVGAVCVCVCVCVVCVCVVCVCECGWVGGMGARLCVWEGERREGKLGRH